MGVMNWRRSSYSSSNGQNCVEVARNPTGAITIRDSKNPDRGYLMLSRGEWQSFTDQIKAGHLG